VFCHKLPQIWLILSVNVCILLLLEAWGVIDEKFLWPSALREQSLDLVFSLSNSEDITLISKTGFYGHSENSHWKSGYVCVCCLLVKMLVALVWHSLHHVQSWQSASVATCTHTVWDSCNPLTTWWLSLARWTFVWWTMFFCADLHTFLPLTDVRYVFISFKLLLTCIWVLGFCTVYLFFVSLHYLV